MASWGGRRAGGRRVRLFLGGRVTHALAGWTVAMEALRKTPKPLLLVLAALVYVVGMTVVVLVLAFWHLIVVLILLWVGWRVLLSFRRRKRDDFEVNRVWEDGPTSWHEWILRYRKGPRDD